MYVSYTGYMHGCTIVVSIDVPWGQISGKAWGSPSGKPVLSLHGKELLQYVIQCMQHFNKAINANTY